MMEFVYSYYLFKILKLKNDFVVIMYIIYYL
jgi:hypothetical protein